jgi:cation-transporting ATPase 13A1
MATLRHRRNSESNQPSLEEEEVIPLLPQPSTNASPDGITDSNDQADGYLLIPLKERSILSRLDVGPFLLLYSLLIALDYSNVEEATNVDDNNEELLSSHVFLQVAFPGVLVAHLTLFLFQQWNVFVRAAVGYQKFKTSPATFSTWTHCLVEAPHVDKHHASHDAGIVPVTFQKQDNHVEVAVANFQDIRFRCVNGAADEQDADVTLWKLLENEKGNGSSMTTTEVFHKAYPMMFHRLLYPIHSPLSFYLKWKGHATLSNVVQAQHVYGNNLTPIDLPPFLELLQDQLVAPFFLFQVLCVILWSLDEYWYYAIFTFFALVLFESTVAFNRLKSLQRLRAHTGGGQQRMVWVYRPGFPPNSNQWSKVSVIEVVPGDIISVKHVSPMRGNNHRGNNPAVQNRIPADILVLQGDAVVDEALLTGESIPQLKVALDNMNGDDRNCLDLQEHKQSILFGGTILLVSHDGSASASYALEAAATSITSSGNTKSTIPQAPNEGVIGMVLRTGFDTAQGSLLRTLAHTQKSVDGIHTFDTYAFIFLLLCCAVTSASMVWRDGWSDPTRNKFRLVLHVIIIITSVVPPELPMELSLAVTHSVADLMHRCQVYCTEVFRIPLAGQVTVCCFDKTGTLTSDEMQLKGVRLVNDMAEFTDVALPDDNLPWPVERVMVACHSLALGGTSASGKDGMANVIGDPLEKAVLKGTDYRLIQNNALRSLEETPGRPSAILILHRFGFTSRLKRMSVLVREANATESWVLTKGAPETIKQFLTPESTPSNYDEIYMHHMGKGQRVLAIAYRELTGKQTIASIKENGRESIERELTFAGFLLLDCPIKPDSSAVISELQKSDHAVVMITGDAVLTAAEVARQVGIIKKQGTSYPPTYHLQEVSANEAEPTPRDALSGFSFVPLSAKPEQDGEEPDQIPLAMSKLNELQKIVSNGQAAFCVSGDVLGKLAFAVVRSATPVEGSSRLSKKDEKHVLLHPSVQNILKELVPLVSVFARHAPRQKEAVVAAFNRGGHHTLMCGDGTNDVGALRRAHVGISIISAPEVEAKQRSATEAISRVKAEHKRERKEKKKGKKSSGSTRQNASSTLEESLRQLQEVQEELNYVELGDASVASPFTSRTASIKCCKDVLQQGRCTLVTMLQIYKILGINCLVNAMVLSTLFLNGVKQGDRQLTILGVAVVSVCFTCVRWS